MGGAVGREGGREGGSGPEDGGGSGEGGREGGREGGSGPEDGGPHGNTVGEERSHAKHSHSGGY